MKVYQFQNKNLIKYSTLNLKESKHLTSFLNVFFYPFGYISNPHIALTNYWMWITFFYYLIKPFPFSIRLLLETSLSKVYGKCVVVEAMPLKYPFLNSAIYSQYIANSQFNDLELLQHSSSTHFIGQLLGITVWIAGWLLKTWASVSEFSVGSVSSFKDSYLFDFKDKNGVKSVSVTLYSSSS